MSTESADTKRIASTRKPPSVLRRDAGAVSIVLLVGVLPGLFAYLACRSAKIRTCLCASQSLSSRGLARAPRRSKISSHVARGKDRGELEDSQIESNTRSGITVVTITLGEEIGDVDKELDDASLKLASLNPEMPSGASRSHFIKDFGDTNEHDADGREPASDRRRDSTPRAADGGGHSQDASGGDRCCVAWTSREPRLRLPCHGRSQRSEAPTSGRWRIRARARRCRARRPLHRGDGFIGLDARTDADEEKLRSSRSTFIRERCARRSCIRCLARGRDPHPGETETKLAQVAEAKYFRTASSTTTRQAAKSPPRSAHRLEGLAQRPLARERVFLAFSQEKLATMDQRGHDRARARARNVTSPPASSRRTASPS